MTDRDNAAISAAVDALAETIKREVEAGRANILLISISLVCPDGVAVSYEGCQCFTCLKAVAGAAIAHARDVLGQPTEHTVH